jgi:hypothetical protein
MAETELNCLEDQIEKVLHFYHKLEEENHNLHKALDRISQEKANLLLKREKILLTIKHLVTKLKEQK